MLHLEKHPYKIEEKKEGKRQHNELLAFKLTLYLIEKKKK